MPQSVTWNQLAEIVARATPSGRETVLVAIEGRGGSGKTTLALWLAHNVADTRVIQGDDFAIPGKQFHLDEWDWRRLRSQVVEPLSRDETARYQRYDWEEDRLAEWHVVEPGGVMIVEGISVTRREIGGSWDLKVWVECPYELRLKRAIERDGEEMRHVWTDLWMPAEERFIEEQRPQGQADYLVLGYASDSD